MSRLLVSLCMLCAGVVTADDVLPAYVLQLPDSVENVLIVETATSTLHRYGHRQNTIESRDSNYVSIGENGVGKRRPWDRRTPLGIYFVTEQLDTSFLDKKYGPTAFPLDYPNAWDRFMNRSGDGIWIHGVVSNGGRRPPLDTDGCIALPNDELLALADKIIPLITPVVIAREIRWLGPEEIASLRGELVVALDRWARSLLNGDLHAYLSSYAEEFEYRGMTRSEWAAYRRSTFVPAVHSFAMDELLLLADPEDTGLFLSRFRQKSSNSERTVETTKRLYWRRSADGRLRIIAEDNG